MNTEKCYKKERDELISACSSFRDAELDESFKETLTNDERFRYELLVIMKKEGYKLINSKFFKKKDVYIPVKDIEDFYQKNEEINLDQILATV